MKARHGLVLLFVSVSLLARAATRRKITFEATATVKATSQHFSEENTSTAADHQSNTRLLFEQQFDWDDTADSGQYIWGQDGFLKMDGSQGRIVCRHRLKREIIDSSSKIVLTELFVVGRKYGITLHDSNGDPVVEAEIQRSGEITFSTIALTKQNTLPNIATGTGGGSTRSHKAGPGQASQLDTIEFSDFDFKDGTFTFTLNRRSYTHMPFSHPAMNISQLSIETQTQENGSLIWLKHFQQVGRSDLPIEDIGFNNYWIPNVAVAKGYPSDKWQKTIYRPRSYRWLEMATHYGAVYVRFSKKPIQRGTVELELMSDCVDHEAQVNLGEYKYDPVGINGYLPADSNGISTISGGWNADVGIDNGSWSPFEDTVENPDPNILHPYRFFRPFDHTPPAKVNQFYRLKIHWDVLTEKYEAWIDGVPQTYNGSRELPMMLMPKSGMDMLMIHAGDSNPRHGPLLHVSWGSVKIIADPE